jgi:hypothetical protein
LFTITVFFKQSNEVFLSGDEYRNVVEGLQVTLLQYGAPFGYPEALLAKMRLGLKKYFRKKLQLIINEP